VTAESSGSAPWPARPPPPLSPWPARLPLRRASASRLRRAPVSPPPILVTADSHTIDSQTSWNKHARPSLRSSARRERCHATATSRRPCASTPSATSPSNNLHPPSIPNPTNFLFLLLRVIQLLRSSAPQVPGRAQRAGTRMRRRPRQSLRDVRPGGGVSLVSPSFLLLLPALLDSTPPLVPFRCKPMDAEDCEPYTDVFFIKFSQVSNARWLIWLQTIPIRWHSFLLDLLAFSALKIYIPTGSCSYDTSRSPVASGTARADQLQLSTYFLEVESRISAFHLKNVKLVLWFCRFAKRKLDESVFLGNRLQVTYAPHFESLLDTKEKLEVRRKEVLGRIKCVAPVQLLVFYRFACIITKQHKQYY
jgi:hypothetical protein